MRPTEVFIFLMLIYITTATRCIIKEKVRRYQLVLSAKRNVRKILVNQNNILITLDRSISQDDPEIHIINLEDDSNSDSSGDPEIIGIHIPDKRKREVWNGRTKVFCKTDKDCGPDEKCIGYLRCGVDLTAVKLSVGGRSALKRDGKEQIVATERS
ncbi:hypothetical protein M0804_001287 [Polistes exclamans]|nr:hypothetical protein M0804_001287 [Polistes exclamans]